MKRIFHRHPFGPACLLAVLSASVAGAQAPTAGDPNFSSRRNSERLWTEAPTNWGRPVYYRQATPGRFVNTQDPSTPDRGNMGMMPGGQGPMGTMPETGASTDIGADFAGPQTASASTDFGADFAAQPTSFGDRATSDSAAASAATNASATRDAGSVDSSAADYTLGNQSDVRATSDTGDLLSRSSSNTGIIVRSLNPVVNDPHIRGYRTAQIRNHADGAFFFPARPDLDSPLSRIDSSVILDIVTIKGPYTVRQGPGFAFVDVSLRPTPRSECGFESSGQVGSTYATNGQQFAGHTFLEGANTDWGFRIGYSHRTGNDYDAGDGTDVAASYNVRNVEVQFGFDLNEYATLNVGYLRNDGTGIQLPSQINDIRFQFSDAFNVRYIADDQERIRIAADAWYNRGRFQGDDSDKDFAALGFNILTNGDVSSAGTRVLTTLGGIDEHQLTLGADFSYVEQEYLEFDSFNPTIPFSYGIPRTHTSNPGVFADTKLIVADPTTARIGGRVDWVSVSYDASSNLATPYPAILPPFDRDFTLWSTFLQVEHKLDDEWTLSAGFGAANRAPTATELYALFPYVSLFQTGPYDYIEGNPFLTPEFARQFDLGLRADYEDFRGGVSFYHSWIDDYITYDPSAGFGGGSIAVNRDATLAGGEAYFEADLSDRLTLFGNLSYVEGRDQVLRIPLWGIPPLQSVLGARLTGERWGLEFLARIVDNQDRVNPFVGGTAQSIREFATAGFTTYNISGYWKATDDLTLTAGVLNLTDKTYIEHLDSRVDANYNDPRGVLRIGRNFYFGGVWQF